MKSLAYSFGIIFILFSCTVRSKPNTKTNSKILLTADTDTLIIYKLEGLSLEGAIVEVYYSQNKIKKSITTLYGESGKAIVTYEFLENSIKVNEIKYQYHADLENLDKPRAVVLEYEVNYILDLNGNRKDRTKDHWYDIFEEFKEAIPFQLK